MKIFIRTKTISSGVFSAWVVIYCFPKVCRWLIIFYCKFDKNLFFLSPTLVIQRILLTLAYLYFSTFTLAWINHYLFYVNLCWIGLCFLSISILYSNLSFCYWIELKRNFNAAFKVLAIWFEMISFSRFEKIEELVTKFSHVLCGSGWTIKGFCEYFGLWLIIHLIFIKGKQDFSFLAITIITGTTSIKVGMIRKCWRALL